MISQIVTNVHFFYWAVLVLKLNKDLLEEVVVVLLHFNVGHGSHGEVVDLGVLVQPEKHDGLGEGGLVVETGAAVAVTTRPDLEVERAVDLILFGAKDGC